MLEFSLSELINCDGAAEWRRGKAKQFPDDRRNLEAAEQFDRLDAEIRHLEGSEAHWRICELIELANNEVDGGRFWPDLNDTISAGLRDVGFHDSFSTGAELVEWYRDTLEEALRDAVNDTSAETDLEAQASQRPRGKGSQESLR
jgi:hypothetical protein